MPDFRDPRVVQRMCRDPAERRAAAKTAAAETLTREFIVDRASVNVESRTVALSFSSELPIERYWGMETLDHSPGACDLNRLNNGGALLMQHDANDQVGVVDSAEIASDRKGRAVVRFSKSARATEILQDVADGIRSLVSVGYMIHEMKLEQSSDQGDSYRITRWEPLEVSIVSIPADQTVGVGRAFSQEERTMPEVTQNTPAAPAVPSAADIQNITNAAREAETARIREITAIGAQFDQAELAREYVAGGKSAEDMRKETLARIKAKSEAAGRSAAQIGMSEREVKQFSFVRLMHALANPTDPRAQEAAAYEREISNAAAKRNGSSPKGFLVPVDVLRSPTFARDLTVGSSTGGGHTVATDLLSQSFIDLLRNRMVLQQAGATILRDLTGNVAIPRQTSGATAYWVAESGAPTESQQAVDQVTLSPKTVGAWTDYSRKLLLQSSIDVEAFVRNDLTKVIGIAIDLAGLYGTGTNQPTGAKLQTGVNTVDFGAAAPTFLEIIDMETQVATDNADIGQMAYIVSAAGRGSLKGTQKYATVGEPIWEDGGTVNGYNAFVSNQVASGDYWFGNWGDLVIGMWSGLDIMADPYTGATSGTVRIVALQDVDVALRHGESLCRGNNTL